MAGFTQNNPVQYKEYVAQNPIEAMTMVGLQREQERKQGEARVQEVWSRVAGVDVLREQDKNYLQQSLNSAKKSATEKLSGDFSNSQIVNQITGAATKIYKDPIVQNAMISTSAVRKGQADMEDARKKGKSSIANEALFNKYVKGYMEDPSADTTFNYKYEEYNDNQKEVFDILKAISPSGVTMDEAFVTVIDKATGQPKQVLNDSVIRNGFKGVKPDQIRAALRAGLSPKAWRQYEIDGMYAYSNYSDQEFASMVKDSYTEDANKINEKLAAIDNASTTSGVEKAELENKRQNLLKELEGIKNEYNGVTSTFASGNVDAGRAKLHTIKSINNLASSMSYGEVQKTYVGDTPQMVERWRQTKQQDLEKWQLEYKQRADFHTDDMNEKKLTRAQKERELNGEYGAIADPLSKDQLPAITIDKFMETNKQIEGEIKGLKDQYLSDLKIDPNSKEGKDKFNSKYNAYLTNPASLTEDEFGYFSKIHAANVELNSNISILDDITKKAEASGNYKKMADFLPSNPEVVTYSDQTGRYEYKAQDFLKAADNFKKFASIIDNRPAGTTVEQGIMNAKRGLSEKEAKLAEMQYRVNTDPKYKATDAQKQIIDRLVGYNETVIKPYGREISRMKNDVETELNNRIAIKQSTDSELPNGTAEQKASNNNLIARIANYADSYSKGKIGDVDSEELRKMLEEDKKTISIQTARGSRFQDPVNNVIITLPSGKYTIPLTPDAAKGVFANRFQGTDADIALDPIEFQINKNGGATTKSGPTPSLSNGDFPSVKNYAVQADVSKSRSTGNYQLHLTVIDPIKRTPIKEIPFPATTDKEGLYRLMSSLNDETIFQLLNGAAPTAKDLELIKQAAQKPF